MILDTLDNFEKYVAMHPSFKRVFEVLKHASELKEGRNEISGEDIFAMRDTRVGKTKDKARVEAHDKYIDVQFILKGKDTMGWIPRSKCKEVSVEYDAVKDAIFYIDVPQRWFDVHAGEFAIFFPQDGHAPSVSDDVIDKIVVKVKI